MLIIVALISLIVFLIPEKYKYLFTLGIISLGAVVAVASAILSLASGVGENAVIFQILGGSSNFVIDPLSAVFIVIVSIAAVSVTIYARDYIASYRGTKSSAQLSLHYAALAMLFFSMIFVVSYRDGFSFLFSWELMTIASFFLILFEGEKQDVRRAAINYLILMHIGFIFILTAFVIGSGGSSLGGFDSLADYFAKNNPLPLFLIFFIGFGMKAGVFPLHIWLPEAHPAAPSHVSALMSGVMIKMGVYGVIRVLTYIDGGLYTVGVVILITGIITALWGIILASLQSDLKKLLAYSSIENIGIIFTGVGIGAIGHSTGNEILAVLGFSGALLHTVNHSFFKPILFMSAGSVYLATHTRNIDELGGLSKRMPMTAILFLVGSLAICAMPPLSGFVSEFLIYLGLLGSISQGGDVLLAVTTLSILALVGGVAVLVFTKAFGISFLGSARCCKAEKAREVGTWIIVGQLMPLAGVIAVGLFPFLFFDGISGVVNSAFKLSGAEFIRIPIMDTMSGIAVTGGFLILFVALIYILKSRVQRRRKIDESPTWGCGFTAPNKFMQYSGESFSEGLSRLTSSLTNDSGGSGEIEKEEIFAKQHKFGVERNDRIDSRVSQLWGYIVHKVNTHTAFFQTGKINHYILQMLLFLVFIFLLTIIGVI